MATFREGTTEQVAFLDHLLDAGLLIRSGVDGVYARGADFERIRLAFDALVTRTAAVEAPESMVFPPVLSRHQIETNGYLGSFPHLLGTVFAFEGDERAATDQLACASDHGDWSSFQSMTDLVLTPAACYPLYPAIAKRGALPEGGLVLDTGDAYVFRREPSSDPSRMQIFHMRELVRIGEPDVVLEWRLAWRDRAHELLRSLGLAVDLDVANDPFFGRAGRLLASQQRDAELKWEMLAPTANSTLTAIASSNYHEAHFAEIYGLRTADGELAHTSCLGFGEERITLALLSAHGLDLSDWPVAILATLGL
jgi:seryl-tRNA synthetase